MIPIFEIKHIKGNTYYFEAFTNVGIYRLNDSEAVLIDACDHPRLSKSLYKQLCEKGLQVKTVINTHCHVDHICGNSFFREKYDCRILSTKGEKGFIAYPDLESSFYYNGIETDKRKNPFFLAEPSESEVINDENTPDGFEIIPLPGHSFDMIGVRTPDNVVFLADAVLAKATWDDYKYPFFNDINKAAETLDMIAELDGDVFVPSHNRPVESIKELAEYNLAKLKEKKALVLSFSEGKSFEEIFALVLKKEEIRIRADKYPMYAIMIRNLLQSLIEDGSITTAYEDYRLVYHLK